ncbi:MAG: DNA polymerase III subunit delta [Amoebophilaceae bacterium]|jgi:DNA polymerase-3 subunit delta|nr:DNA polymerase III subunit delta [Amoebophilaceae bacterium]
MAYTPQQVLTALKQRIYAPVYFFHGEEPYYIDTLVNYIESNVLNASEKDFNLTVVYGRDRSMHEILTYARRFPLGSERQVVIVKEAQELQDFNKEEGSRLLEVYVQSPQPATLLVWAYKYKVLDPRKSLSRALAQKSVLVHAKKLYDNQVAAWVSAYVQEKGLSITEKATLMLQEYIGNDLSKLANELEKIQLNLGKATNIDDSMVQAYVGISRKFNVFELQKALAQKDAMRALQIVLHFGEHPGSNPAIPLVALLCSFFSKLLLLHHAKDKSESALAKVLQVSFYFVRDYLLAAQNYPLNKVIKNIQHLHQADLQLKGVGYPATSERQILQELVLKMMH